MRYLIELSDVERIIENSFKNCDAVADTRRLKRDIMLRLKNVDCAKADFAGPARCGEFVRVGKRAEWKWKNNAWYCGSCNHRFKSPDIGVNSNFCPECGAPMNGFEARARQWQSANTEQKESEQ